MNLLLLRFIACFTGLQLTDSTLLCGHGRFNDFHENVVITGASRGLGLAMAIVFRRIVEAQSPGDRIEIDSAGTICHHSGNPPDKRMSATLRARAYEPKGSPTSSKTAVGGCSSTGAHFVETNCRMPR